ncbi:Oxidoreductase-like N-terminal [Penicillium angulare]|uniref:Oxidoreductase-like N-terminal n=1 Tax=Penicillium angulare TaxID=116970 RepID=UPI00253FA8C1|nr:Oxidoreductase-like N-terminal [Penicillium angulare]KAJ5273987.1 Oxidoreductase-like N-terminal [Penicillium angulare]
MAHSRTDTRTQSKQEEMPDQSQAYPLSGYYALILKSDSPYYNLPVTARSTAPRPEEKPKEEQTPEDKMSIVFGTRLAGPGRQSRYNPGEAPPESEWQTINGVPIPPQPEKPENCCMSGCVHCVWDDFRDEMEEWAGRAAIAKAKGGLEKGTRDMRTAPRSEVDSASLSMDDDGGGSEANWPAPSQDDDLFANIPVGIREFMKTEKKLRVKHQNKATI